MKPGLALLSRGGEWYLGTPEDVASDVPVPDEAPSALGPLRRLVAEVARQHGMSPLDLIGRGRAMRIVKVRQEAMYRAVAETGISIADICRRFDRNHTTVLHAINMHALRNGLSIPRGALPLRRVWNRSWRAIKPTPAQQDREP